MVWKITGENKKSFFWEKDFSQSKKIVFQLIYTVL